MSLVFVRVGPPRGGSIGGSARWVPQTQIIDELPDNPVEAACSVQLACRHWISLAYSSSTHFINCSPHYLRLRVSIYICDRSYRLPSPIHHHSLRQQSTIDVRRWPESHLVASTTPSAPARSRPTSPSSSPRSSSFSPASAPPLPTV